MPWRRGTAQNSFIKLVEEIVYGTRYDSQIKAMLRNNKTARQIEMDEGFAEPLQEVRSLRASAMREQEKDQLLAQEEGKIDSDDDASKGA